MKLLAHLTNDDSRRREQSLKEHCFHVAEYAAESIGSARLYHTVIIAYAIGAHHGMFDCTDLDGKNGFLHRLQRDRDEICNEEAICNYFSEVAEERLIDEYFPKAVREVEEFFSIAKSTYGSQGGGKIFFQISMLVRLVLSAVIYGDRRDTSEFMEQKKCCQTFEILLSGKSV